MDNRNYSETDILIQSGESTDTPRERTVILGGSMITVTYEPRWLHDHHPWLSKQGIRWSKKDIDSLDDATVPATAEIFSAENGSGLSTVLNINNGTAEKYISAHTVHGGISL